jgi:threonine efflux protein
MDWHAVGTVAMVYSLAVMSPGPNLVAVVHRAVSSSRIETIALVAGLVLVNAFWASAAILGVGIAIGIFPWVFWALRIGGALYLVWFGIKLFLRAGQTLEESAAMSARGVVNAARAGVTTNLANPKSIAFYGSIFSTIVPDRTDVITSIAMVSAVVAIASVWYGGVALLISWDSVARVYRRMKGTVERCCGVILILFGGKLALWK